MNQRINALLLLVNLFFSASCLSRQYTLTFNRPESTPQSNYVIELLKLAYADIGYKIHIIDFDRQNALLAANEGVLDGQLGRDISVENNSNLIRVDYEILKFNLVVYKNCQPNTVNQLESIAILPSYTVQERYLTNTLFPGNIIKVKNLNTQLNLFAQHKVQGILLLDYQLTDKAIPKNCFIKETLMTYPIYHYLNINNKHLVEKLKNALIKLNNNGTVYALRARYNLKFKNQTLSAL